MPNLPQPKISLSSHWEVIDDFLLKYTFDSDQAIYPAPSLTYDRLRSWVESYPELCIVLRRGDGQDDSQPQVSAASAVSESVLGAVIVVPLLGKYWVQLIAEDPLLQEHDVDPGEMFPPRADTEGSEQVEVGLHVFHIERFPGFTTDDGRGHGFTQLALEEIGGRVGQGRKRPRLSVPAKKTPNDLVWEALTSSAPVLAEDAGWGLSTDDEVDDHVAQELEERLQATGKPVIDGLYGQDTFDPIVEEKVSPEDAAEYENAEEDVQRGQTPEVGAARGASPKKPGGKHNESVTSTETDITELTSSFRGHKTYFSTTSTGQNVKVRPPFLTFDNPPPRGYKVVNKRDASPERKTPAKKKNQCSDGFSDGEARPSHAWKKRRLRHLEPKVGSLELTLKAATSQRPQSSSSRNSKMKEHSHPNVRLWHSRQYFGTSQFDFESQDSVETFEVKQEEVGDEDLAPTGLGVHGSQESAYDAFDLIVIPRSDTPVPGETEERGAAAVELTELEAEHRAHSHLPPKRILVPDYDSSDGLTLRPTSLRWLRGFTRISETPPMSDAANLS
ncbi:hypothetical protein VPNG_03174 [Cytospora leucostoma]|uniref:Uncharacterized protein n=1 Tax=Cytospora leucostoma TaxID=1230097 RepID=A0A423XEJ9_9PEZI|nr:hypothetical protein VPNG_03174 [Cytospora leucostoma]